MPQEVEVAEVTTPRAETNRQASDEEQVHPSRKKREANGLTSKRGIHKKKTPGKSRFLFSSLSRNSDTGCLFFFLFVSDADKRREKLAQALERLDLDGDLELHDRAMTPVNTLTRDALKNEI